MGDPWIQPFNEFLKRELKDYYSKTVKERKEILPRLIANTNVCLSLISKLFIGFYKDDCKTTFQDGTAVGFSPLYGGCRRIHKYFADHPIFKRIKRRHHFWLFLALDAIKMDKHFSDYRKFLGSLFFFHLFDLDFDNITVDMEIWFFLFKTMSYNNTFPHIAMSRSNVVMVNRNYLPSGSDLTTFFGNMFSHTNSRIAQYIIMEYLNHKEKIFVPEKILNSFKICSEMMLPFAQGDDLMLAMNSHFAQSFSPLFIKRVIEEITGIEYKLGECHSVENPAYVPFFSEVKDNKVVKYGIHFLKKLFIRKGNSVLYFVQSKDLIGRMFKSHSGIRNLPMYSNRLVGIMYHSGINTRVLDLCRQLIYKVGGLSYVQSKMVRQERNKAKVRRTDINYPMPNEFFFQVMLPKITSFDLWASRDKAFLEKYPYSAF
jgi:hypothetical protein